MSKEELSQSYYCQAMYFLEAAMAVTKDAQERSDQNPIHFNNYQFVIVGTHHAFASELLLKGILLGCGIVPPREHNLSKIFNMPEMNSLKNAVESNFNRVLANSINSNDAMYATYESNYRTGSFDFYLDFHAKHFVEIRYACEAVPKGLDMDFTSFLCNELKSELFKIINK